MEDAIQYSVIIRTIGNAGEKYRKLLQSIQELTPQPQEVVVVLPHGYDKPQDQLGYETFIYSEKGMYYQRVRGIEYCKTRYALLCDDDVCFEKEFVSKLHKPIEEGLCSISAAPLYSFLPKKGLMTVTTTIMTSAMPTVFHKDRYVTVLKGTGYSFNRRLDMSQTKYYESMSVAGTCFYCDVEALRKCRLQDEFWMDDHGYAAMEDQTMIYKAWLNGYKTIVVSNAYYEHMDGKTSIRNNSQAANYSLTYNRVIFWDRFIYRMERGPLGRLSAKICFGYRMGWHHLYNRLSVIRKTISKEDAELMKKAYKDAKAYIQTQEYEQIQEQKKVV